MLVVDASAIVAVILGSEPAASQVSGRLWAEESSNPLHVPHIFDIEVLHTLRQHVLRRGLSEERATIALGELTSLGATRYPHDPLLHRIWDLKDNLTAYDAAYVALAESLAAPLVTLDAKLARAPGIRAPVEVYG